MFDGVDGFFGYSQHVQGSQELSPRLILGKSPLDHLRKGLSLFLEAREDFVRIHVNRDRFYCHALIVH